MMQPIVNVENLSHIYMQGTPLEHRALDQVSIQVAEGECLAIIGHTGSGKSTLIQHFNGLIRPQSGTVIINGMDVSSPKIDIRTLRRQVGLVFQNPEDQLFEKLVGDDVAYGPFRMGLPLEEVRRRVQWAMDLVGLSFQEMKDRPTFALSGGQKRKVALAGVLSLQPKVLVLDEPTAGLDPRSRLELLDRIRRLNREEKLTVIFVSHNMEEVAKLADRVYVMANGQSVCEGTPRQIFGNQELLRQHHIGTPESVDILYRLHEQGYSIDPSAFLPEETAMEILKLLNR
ncbi:energy-coupling factor transporter ATPase [Brevibacillus formosus]|uniref:Energy-coupling factor transporter ATP-binding protein EcfA2 n=1 Tax=Brevibacillus formosus TaxID=54913 RepID=A0A837KSQ2_9BACL|nr:energy-coupling factor transporter ATPase [Brevibacillus formosus]KLH99941.1 cobalt transporter ATP-binding subunit [Brevibacillus formosus]MED1959485.1 energy-coupling factor transporter ATPase [Brevibacillus formosus]PSJ96003.1 energy-coupling factor transporter ATPase [Brevibacillus formosus]GED56358.1 energy-coupling factor transporter ATP-binding protein EcfA [Brevibacillus formosus]